MPASDREVFAYLKADESTPHEVNLLAFAMFANDRDEWIKHFEAQNGQAPTQDQVNAWTADITDYRFQQMRNEAATFFDVAARAYMQEEMQAARMSVLESEIIARVSAAGNFWRQLFIALGTAILAPVIIGLVIAAYLAYNHSFPALISTTSPVTEAAPEGER
jgi:fatty acid desaturase